MLLRFGFSLQRFRLHNRQLGVVAPVFEGAVVEMGVVAEVASDEVKQAGLLSDVSIGSHGVALLHGRSVEKFAQRGDTFEFVA